MLIIYSVSFSLNMSACNYIGISVGKLNKELCQKYIKVIICYSLSILLIIVPILFYFKSNIAGLYTTNKETIEIISDVWPYVVLLIVIDFIQNVSVGISKGLRRHEKVIKIWILVQYVFGIPILSLVIFKFHFELMGLWLTQSMNILFVDLAILFVLLKDSLDTTIQGFKAELEEIQNNREIKTLNYN